MHPVQALARSAIPTTDDCAAHPPPPLPKRFAWYALVYDDSRDTYSEGLVPLGSCATLVEFCQYLNYLTGLLGDVFAPRGASKAAAATRHRPHRVKGLCFFESATKPEWEDPHNRGGVDLVYRCGGMPPGALAETWLSLLLLFVNDQLTEDATGMRLVFKRDRRGGLVHKFEVWTRSADVGARVLRSLREHVGLDFACVPRRTE